jgi:hypothetical protein
MKEIFIKTVEVIAGLIIVVLQFLPNPSQYRFVVIGLVGVIAVCSFCLQLIEKRRRKLWEEGQVERDRTLVRQTIQELKPVSGSSATLAVQETRPPAKSAEVLPHDPRIYASSIKESQDAMFPRTPFVLINRGGDVAHKVKTEMLFKLRGQNVFFPEVETVPVNEPCEILPTIGEESLMTKHDIFHWLLDDWNANAGGLVEEWPKELNIRWQNYNGDKFVCAVTLVFHPLEYLLERNANWPAHEFTVSEFKNLRFSRE